ncbi:PRA1 family protein B3-like [Aristolochia californica]|uniref:PRA1 family protein B3-like n=1 Tax=Aristolochia californica TaxID=171875 RepID=UPI0035D873DA
MAQMASQPPQPPLSIPSAQTAGASASPITAANTPAFRAFISRLSDSVRLALSQRRPWSELLDRTGFSRPDSLSDATARFRKNLSYFRINYLIVISSVLALSLLSHPFSLLLLVVLLSAWLFLYLFRPSDSPVVILGRQFSDRETLVGLVGLTIVVVFLTSVGSVLITASMVGFAIVAAHGAFRMPEDLFLDDQEPAAAGLLSFLGGAASAAASAPAIVTRV